MIGEDSTRGIAEEFRRLGPEFERALEREAPKDEGRLAAAAHHRVSSDGLGLSVGYSKEKTGFKRLWKKGGFEALFAEFGTRHHAAQPFIRRTFRAMVRHALDRIDRAVSQSIKGALRK